jgi:hypothetical protein
MTRAERRAHWHSIINNQATSGVSAAAYCRESRINRHLFYSWRRRFRKAAWADAGGFIELRAGDSFANDAGISIRLDTGLCIDVARGFDPATLCVVIDTLTRRRCSA